MNLDEATRALESDSAKQRMGAAYYFLVQGSTENLEILKAARAGETDFYIGQRLDQAIRSISQPKNTANFDHPESDTVEAGGEGVAVLAQATEWVGGLILHEMEGYIGRASLYAAREFDNYSRSRTKVELDGLKNVFRGIEQLVSASKTPKPSEFDLADLIEDIASEFREVLPISAIGSKPLLISSDKGLLGMAVRNGLKNAVESMVGQEITNHPITINWGITDKDVWISIIDKGVGVKNSTASNFEIGSSTKEGHSGFGLAVSRRAMSAIDGSVTLRAQSDIGTVYELRWERST